jgi:hypothetical protein
MNKTGADGEYDHFKRPVQNVFQRRQQDRSLAEFEFRD